MAEKKGMIVIKKITVAGGGHHGGSWKVALADFMTAMMAFFLVMWLLNQSEETKKAVSDYFSTPSVIEYNFQNFGAELTLEKLFLDLVNEPLKAIQDFVEPAEKSPNLLDMGSKHVVMAALADQLGDVARNVVVHEDGAEFIIPDTQLFEPGTANPNKDFIANTDKLKGITSGLADADVVVTSMLFNESVRDSLPDLAKKVAEERADILKKKIEASLDVASVGVQSKFDTGTKTDYKDGQPRPIGLIKIKLQQRPVKTDGRKARKLETVFGDSDPGMSVYDSFVKQISKQKAERADKSDRPEKVEKSEKTEKSAKPENVENAAE